MSSLDFQAALDTPLDSPFSATLSVHSEDFSLLVAFLLVTFSWLFRGFFRGFFVALFCLEKQCSGLYRYLFVVFSSWLFRGFFVAPVLGKFYAYSPWNSLLIHGLHFTVCAPSRLLSAKRKAYFRKSIAIEVGGVSPYFSKNTGVGGRFDSPDIWSLLLFGNPVQIRNFEKGAFARGAFHKYVANLARQICANIRDREEKKT